MKKKISFSYYLLLFRFSSLKIASISIFLYFQISYVRKHKDLLLSGYDKNKEYFKFKEQDIKLNKNSRHKVARFRSSEFVVNPVEDVKL